MLEENTFARADTFPSWFANALQKFLSVSAGNFQVVATDATHVKVAAGADDQAAAIAIHGLWRWSEVDVGPVAHPGGAAGTYPAFATCKNNSIVSTPLPYTDVTDRSFGLQIKAPGATPTIVAGTVDQYRHVADVFWDGATITRVQPLVPLPPSAAALGALGFVEGAQIVRQGAAHSNGRAYHELDTNKMILDLGGTWLPVNLNALRTSAANPNPDIGDMVFCTASSQTVLLPDNSRGIVGVMAAGTQNSANAVLITTHAGQQIIRRGAMSGSSTLTLGTPGAAVLLLFDGVDFRVIAGEEDLGWVPLTLGTGVTASTQDFTPALRVRGDTAQTRGILHNNSGGTLGAGSVVATLPIAPPAGQQITLVGANVSQSIALVYRINSSGQMVIEASLGAAQDMAINTPPFSILP